jgi:hypothetical protein
MGYGVNGALDGLLSWLYYDFLDYAGLSNVLLLPTLCLFRGCFVCALSKLLLITRERK